MLPDSIVYHPDFQALFEPLRENPKDPTKVNIDYGRANILGDWLEEHQDDAHPQILWFANLIRGDLSVLVKPKPTNPVYQEKTLAQILNACFLRPSFDTSVKTYHNQTTKKGLQRRVLDQLHDRIDHFWSYVWTNRDQFQKVIHDHLRSLTRIANFRDSDGELGRLNPHEALFEYDKKIHFHYPVNWTDALLDFSPTWPITGTRIKMQKVCRAIFRRICDLTVDHQGTTDWLFKKESVWELTSSSHSPPRTPFGDVRG